MNIFPRNIFDSSSLFYNFRHLLSYFETILKTFPWVFIINILNLSLHNTKLVVLKGVRDRHNSTTLCQSAARIVAHAKYEVTSDTSPKTDNNFCYKIFVRINMLHALASYRIPSKYICEILCQWSSCTWTYNSNIKSTCNKKERLSSIAQRPLHLMRHEVTWCYYFTLNKYVLCVNDIKLDILLRI